MRMSLRLIFSLVASVTIVSILFAFYQVRADNHARRVDLEKRAQVLAESLQEAVEPLFAHGAQGNLGRIVERFGNRERLDGVAIYDAQGHATLMTPNLNARLGAEPPALDKRVLAGLNWGRFFGSEPQEAHVYAVPVRTDGQVVGALAVFHDASYIGAQNSQIWRDTFKHVLVQMLLIVDHHITDRALEHGTSHRPHGAMAARSSRGNNDVQSGSACRGRIETDHAGGDPLGHQPQNGARIGGRGGQAPGLGRFALDRGAVAGLSAVRAGGQPVVCGFQPRALRACAAQRIGGSAECRPAD